MWHQKVSRGLRAAGATTIGAEGIGSGVLRLALTIGGLLPGERLALQCFGDGTTIAVGFGSGGGTAAAGSAARRCDRGKRACGGLHTT